MCEEEDGISNRITMMALTMNLVACATPKDSNEPIDVPASSDRMDSEQAEDSLDNPHDSGGGQGSHSNDNLDTGGESIDSDTGQAGASNHEFGEITGDCGVLDLPHETGVLFQNAIDFGVDPFDETALSEGGSAIFSEGTLGGSSVHSEVMAFEVLHRCESAFLLKSETQIEYIDEAGKKTDMLVQIDDQAVGVSVTRAFKWGEDVVYTEEDARTLLSDKLSDVLLSAANAADTSAWRHSILHVITHDPSYLPSLESAYAHLPGDLKDGTIVWFTVTNGSDEFIY